ncbi:hypothetical protein CPC08DRAFT_737803 [Agrocybe pediades]|nr:hypothetical protein CPC08DRAFT_737803 [Agrocybe pediades]
MPQFTKLGATNYPTWAGEMQAWLRAQSVWRIVSGESTIPTLPSPPTEAQLAAYNSCAVLLMLCVEDDKKIHLTTISDDPKAMWKKLEDIHRLQKRPGTRFDAYDDLFSIRKKDDETLQTLMNRVDIAIKQIQDLRPTPFDLKTLDEELACMALIRALPEEFSNFASSLLLLDKLERATIQQAFVSEESQRRHRASEAPKESKLRTCQR